MYKVTSTSDLDLRAVVWQCMIVPYCNEKYISLESERSLFSDIDWDTAKPEDFEDGSIEQRHAEKRRAFGDKYGHDSLSDSSKPDGWARGVTHQQRWILQDLVYLWLQGKPIPLIDELVNYFDIHRCKSELTNQMWHDIAFVLKTFFDINHTNKRHVQKVTPIFRSHWQLKPVYGREVLDHFTRKPIKEGYSETTQ